MRTWKSIFVYYNSVKGLVNPQNFDMVSVSVTDKSIAYSESALLIAIYMFVGCIFMFLQ